MKLATCLALFAITSFVASQSATEPDFVFSNTWRSAGTIPADLEYVSCCMPEGTLTFSNDASQVLLRATRWNGLACTIGLPSAPEYVPFPFSNTSSFTELVADGNQTSVWDTIEELSVTFSVGNYTTNSTTGDISWTMSLNFEQMQGKICTVTLTNSPAPAVTKKSKARSDEY